MIFAKTLGALPLCLIVPGMAFAQSPAESSDGEIIVTATKREVSLNKSAGSITAVSGEQLEARSVSSLDEAFQVAPNVSYEVTTQQGPAINIRGVTNNGNGVGFEAGVSAYTDEVYLARPSGFTSILADIERIEVLRGPQGTLFGKNTVGGLLHIITKKPVNHFEASGDATYGSRNLVQVRGTVNVPIAVDKAAIRVTGIFKDQDGWERNRTPGSKALYGENFKGARGHLLLTPSDRFEMLVSADYGETKGTGDQHLDTDGNPRDRVTTVGPFGRFDRKNYGFSSRITGDMGGADLISLTAYRVTDTLAIFDQDFSAAPGVLTKFPERDKTITQELRLQNSGSGPLDIAVGVYYLHGDTDNAIQVLFGNDSGAPAGIVDTRIVNDSISGFVSTEFDISDRVTLTGGVRYTHEKKKFDFATRTFSAPLPVGSLRAEGGLSQGDFSGDVGVNFQVNDQLFAYLKFAHGFKAGGFDNVSAFQSGALTTIATGGFIPFDIAQFIFRPETVDNYEGGFKYASSDGRFSLFGSAFYMDYKDKQEQISRLATLGGITLPLNTTANAAAVEIYGVELQATGALFEWWKIDASLGYLHAEYQSFVNPVGTTNLTGNTLTRSPRWTGSLASTFTTDIGNEMKGTARAEASYRSRSFLASDNNAFAVQNGHVVINARIGVEANDRQWGIFAFGKNITDKNVFLAADAGLNGGIPIAPASYGVELRFQF
jgi:iron complex outermembrane receptor protein